MAEEREIQVESVNTPKGSVPTVKGVEKVINQVYNDIQPLASTVSSFVEAEKDIQKRLTSIELEVKQIKELLSAFIGFISKLNLSQKLDKLFETMEKLETFRIDAAESDLLELRQSLASILVDLKKEVPVVEDQPDKK
ncbi:MAG: hypothetical protein ACFFCQ_09405 [Promethearchaeota archaeon]